MKKKIFFLMLGVAIFTMDPAFCMDEEKELLRGAFRPLSTEIEVMVFENLDNISTRAMASTSSYFYGLMWGNILSELDLYISYNFTALQEFHPQTNYEKVSFSLCDEEAGFLKNISFCTDNFLTNNFDVYNSKEENSRGLIQRKVILHRYGVPNLMIGGFSENLKEFPQQRLGVILWPQHTVFNSKKNKHEIVFVRNSDTSRLPPMNLYINSSLDSEDFGSRSLTIKYTMGDHVGGQRVRYRAQLRELTDLRDFFLQNANSSDVRMGERLKDIEEQIKNTEEQIKKLEENDKRKL